MMKTTVNLKEWKQSHPKLYAIAKLSSKNKEYGIIIINSNRKDTIEHAYENYRNDDDYIML